LTAQDPKLVQGIVNSPFFPRAHGAWLILATAILLGVLSGVEPGKGTLALSLAAIAAFCSGERWMSGARKPALIHFFTFSLASIWALQEVAISQLFWIGMSAGGFALTQWLLRKRRVASEINGMVALSLALPAVSLASGCPIGWPLFTLSALFSLHVLHAALRTRAHLAPKRRPIARTVGLIGGLFVLALLLTGNLGVPLALAMVIGLAEPWAPDWTPLKVKSIGWRETALLVLIPASLIVESFLG
jgi:hypothetical protein